MLSVLVPIGMIMIRLLIRAQTIIKKRVHASQDSVDTVVIIAMMMIYSII